MLFTLNIDIKYAILCIFPFIYLCGRMPGVVSNLPPSLFLVVQAPFLE